MPPRDDDTEYLINIEYDDFLTRFDIDEVLTSIDRIIENELLYYPMFELDFPRRYPYGIPYWKREDVEFSYIGIKSISHGSVSLTVLIGSHVAVYVAKRFKKGVDKSLLAEQIERSGRLRGDLIGHVLSKVSDWAEQYVPKQRQLGGKIKKIAIEKKSKTKPKS